MRPQWTLVPKSVTKVQLQAVETVKAAPHPVQHEVNVLVDQLQPVELLTQVSQPRTEMRDKVVPRFETQVVERAVDVPLVVVQERPVEVPMIQTVEQLRQDPVIVAKEVI